MSLPDLLERNLKIVFCGTAAGKTSDVKQEYYAHHGNRFWPTLHLIGLTPRQLDPSQYSELLKYQIGLTDLVKSVVGNDSELSRGHFNCAGLRVAIENYQPEIVAFTSKRAAKEFTGAKNLKYGLLEQKEKHTILFVLPSPSGMARKWWDENYWRQLASLYKNIGLHGSGIQK